MAYTPADLSYPQNPDPQRNGVPENDITHPQEQLRPKLGAPLPACLVVVDHGARLPQSLVEWLARINRHYLALNQEKTGGTG